MEKISQGAAVRQEQNGGGGVVESTQGEARQGKRRVCLDCGHVSTSSSECAECNGLRRPGCWVWGDLCRYADEPESDAEPTGPIYRKLDPARVRFDVNRELAEWWHRLTGGDMKQALDELAAAGKLGVVVADVEVGRGEIPQG